jgi:GT2 family glycosyltransferase
MLVSRAVLEAVGTFDEEYFFGFEEVEFCLRARARGFLTVVTSDLAYHEGGHSLRSQTLPLYYASRNHLRMAARLHGRSLSRTLRIIALNAAFATRASPRHIPSRLSAVTRGTLDHFRGRYGAAPEY